MGKRNGNGIYDSGTIKCKPNMAERISKKIDEGTYPGFRCSYQKHQENGQSGSYPNGNQICSVEIYLDGAKRSVVTEFRKQLRQWGISQAMINLP
jgi:hypothetical protein